MDGMGSSMDFRYEFHQSRWWVDGGFLDDLGCLMGSLCSLVGWI